MTGIECLKAELLKRGFNKSQAESKVVIGVLEILTESSGKYSDMDQLLKDINSLKAEESELQRNIYDFRRTSDTLKLEFKEIISEIEKYADNRYKQTTDYIDTFFKALSECETPEARDSLKVAQTYINAVSIDTKYDNTAFIIGLASILSQGHAGAIEQLRKINPKIPEIKLDVTTSKGSFYGYDRKIWRVTEKREKDG